MLRKFAVGICFIGGILSTNQGFSQSDIIGREYNPIRVAAPFLTITPDSRAAGYGDQGVASSADNNSQYWNPAKYIFADSKGGFSLSYTPWLKNIINGISLSNLAGYYKVDDNQSLSTSLRYFSLGEVEFTDNSNTLQKQFKPNEFAFDAAYTRRLNDVLSSAIGFRYISSNLTGGYIQDAVETTKASSFAADISLYLEKQVRMGYNDAEVAFGMSIANIGSKVSYSDNENSKSYLPTTLRIGGRYSLTASQMHKVTALVETSKLLVPTPKYDEQGNNLNANESVVSSIFSSFGDASGGVKEELNEFTLSLGAEYTFNNTFSLRVGSFNESKNKGNRKFFTIGGGLKYNLLILDVAYLVPTSNSANNPLANTFRITIGAELGQDMYGKNSRSRGRIRGGRWHH
jgi:hypothetical protein